MARFDGAVLDAKPWGRGVAGWHDWQLPAALSERPAEQSPEPARGPLILYGSCIVTKNMVLSQPHSVVQTETYCNMWFNQDSP